MMHVSHHTYIWHVGRWFMHFVSVTVWETKFLQHSPENRCPIYVLYKIPLAQADFLLAQLKMHTYWRAGKR